MTPGQAAAVFTGPNGKPVVCVDLCESSTNTMEQVASLAVEPKDRTLVQKISIAIGKKGGSDMCNEVKEQTESGVVCTEQLDVVAPGSHPEDAKRAVAYYAKQIKSCEAVIKKTGK